MHLIRKLLSDVANTMCPQDRTWPKLTDQQSFLSPKAKYYTLVKNEYFHVQFLVSCDFIM